MKTFLMQHLTSGFHFLFGKNSAEADGLTEGKEAFEQKDYATALKIWERLAKKGSALAQFNLGWMYASGKGAQRDPALYCLELPFLPSAHMWWNVAASQGSSAAEVNKELIEKDMSPSQIEKAQDLARDWADERYEGAEL